MFRKNGTDKGFAQSTLHKSKAFRIGVSKRKGLGAVSHPP